MQEMQRLLFVFSKLNPGLQYVQGMNELVAPLYMIFKVDGAEPDDKAHAEADCFFCLVKLLTLSEVRDLYCKSLDRSTSGVQAVMREYAPAHFHLRRECCRNLCVPLMHIFRVHANNRWLVRSICGDESQQIPDWCPEMAPNWFAPFCVHAYMQPPVQKCSA